MSTGVSAFDTTIQETNCWLSALVQRLGSDGRQDAYAGLRASLHVLRDRLPGEMVMALSAQLPMLLRGLFLEGWRPGRPPTDARTAAAFAQQVSAELPLDYPFTGEETARAVFEVLTERVGPGLPEKLKLHLPRALHALWPEPSASYVTGDWP
jgi:uncharacterized protein (DUF2267 family)